MSTPQRYRPVSGASPAQRRDRRSERPADLRVDVRQTQDSDIRRHANAADAALLTPVGGALPGERRAKKRNNSQRTRASAPTTAPLPDTASVDTGSHASKHYAESNDTVDVPAQAMPSPLKPTTSRKRGALIGLDPSQAEADDYLHIPDKNANAHSVAPSWRGIINVLTLALIVCALLLLFAGYPILANVDKLYDRVNAYTGQSPGKNLTQIPVRKLIDNDTPASAHTFTSKIDQSVYELVFSDEFNAEGRTFWPGDDPYWEAVDAWYSGTHDWEWYTPGTYCAQISC